MPLGEGWANTMWHQGSCGRQAPSTCETGISLLRLLWSQEATLLAHTALLGAALTTHGRRVDEKRFGFLLPPPSGRTSLRQLLLAGFLRAHWEPSLVEPARWRPLQVPVSLLTRTRASSQIITVLNSDLRSTSRGPQIKIGGGI